MKIAVLSSRFPYPLERGDKLRLYHQLRVLSNYHDLYLISISDRGIDTSELKMLKVFCREVIIHKINIFQKALGVFASLMGNRPFQTALSYHGSIHKKIKAEIQQISPDLIYCQLIRMAPYCEGLTQPKVLDFMDAFSVGMQRRASLAPPYLRWLYKMESERVAKIEFSSLKKFNASTVISEQDRKLIDPGKKCDIQVIPNGIDLDYFTYNYVVGAKFDVSFVGNLGYLPNVDAAHSLLKKISTIFHTKTGRKLSIHIAGARPDASLKPLINDVSKLSSWVEDVRSAYLSAKIFVAPLFFGTGQQNKILEAMALGLPCITTTLVNNAIGAKRGKEIIIADSAEAFANAIIELLLNKEKLLALSYSGREFVEKNYPWNHSVDKLNNVFKKVILSNDDRKHDHDKS